MTRVVSPLSWPHGWKRNKQKRSGALGRKSTVLELIEDIRREAIQFSRPAYGGRLDVRSLVVTFNRAAAEREDFRIESGAAVYFTFDARPTVLACDQWYGLKSNLAAIAKHLAAMRGMARWGVGSLGQAFTGYLALMPGTDQGGCSIQDDDWEAPPISPVVEWATVLGVPRSASLPVARAAYLQKIADAHPDAGGSHSRAALINDAWAAARAEIMRRR